MCQAVPSASHIGDQFSMKEGFLLKVFRVIVGGILFVLLTILFLISDILWDLGETFFFVVFVLCGIAFLISLYISTPVYGKVTLGICTCLFSPFGFPLLLEWLSKKLAKYRNKVYWWMKG